jgi:error-prone DNA polymerase
LLNSQPMGFYAPAQIVGDARRHGVEIRPVDVNFSDRDCTLEPAGDRVALRLGFRQVKGLAAADGEAIVAARGDGYDSVPRLWRRAGVGRAALTTLADADAFGSVGLDRQRALWAVKGLDEAPLPLFAAADASESRPEPSVELPAITLGEQVTTDYRVMRLSLKAHPLALLRRRLDADRFLPAARLTGFAHGRRIKVAGLVITRQRPGSANGVIFVTLEDETGHANLIVWPKIFERFRQTTLGSTLLGVAGPVQREGEVVHVLAERLWNLDTRLDDLAADETGLCVPSRDFH